MKSKNTERIQTALTRVVQVSKAAKCIFLSILVVYCLVAAGVFIMAAPSFYDAMSDPSAAFFILLRLLATLMAAVTPAVVFYTIFRLFDDISKGSSPFTLAQAHRMQVIGVLLLLGVVLGSVLPLMPVPYSEIGDLSAGMFSTSSSSAGVKIELTSVLWAIVCFSFSYVFRYGALLQQLSDETV